MDDMIQTVPSNIITQYETEKSNINSVKTDIIDKIIDDEPIHRIICDDEPIIDGGPGTYPPFNKI